jgi:hypothetical protein
MFRRQLIIQEGLWAMPLHKLVLRSILVSSICTVISMSGLVLATNRIAKQVDELEETKEETVMD